MNSLKENMHLMSLYDIYKKLLTETQKHYFEQYYFNDYSLHEIAENEGISRSAVHDLLKRVNVKLFEYESLLKCQEQQTKLVAVLEQLKALNNDSVNEIIKRLGDIDV
jgi:predicted DNA-binding protein YlxM (UPF0122 family)